MNDVFNTKYTHILRFHPFGGDFVAGSFSGNTLVGDLDVTAGRMFSFVLLFSSFPFLLHLLT